MTPDRSFWSGKRVLLTGHTGFKGTWATLWLERLGAEVTGLGLSPDTSPALWLLANKPGRGRLGDVRDRAAVHAAFAESRPEIVIHMAAQALVQRSYADPASTFATNVMGLVHVLDEARADPHVRAVVIVTSDKCYENVGQIWPYRESERMGGADPYSASKGCAELVTASYRRSYFQADGARLLASGRAGNVIGGGDWSADRLLPDCVRAWTAGDPVTVRNPAAIRPWQHVLEPISGYFALAEALFERGHVVADGWNFGPPDLDAWSVGDLIERAAALWGEPAAWRRDENEWPEEARLLRLDSTKARHGLGWRSRLQTGEALRWTIDWYRAVGEGQSAREATLRQIDEYAALAVGV